VGGVTSPISLGWFVAATLLLLGAHMVRAVRWGFLFPKAKAGDDRAGLLVGLSIGYAINALVPLRIGELFRALVAKRLRGDRLAEVLATILIERTADLLVLALVFVATWQWATDPVQSLRIAAFFAATGFVVAGGILALRWSRGLRSLLWKAAGVFNPRIRVGLADLSWSAGEILAGLSVAGWRFTLTTVAMWGLYGAAFGTFAHAAGVSFGAVSDALLQHPLTSPTLNLASPAAGIGSLHLYTFIIAPILLILLLDRLARTTDIARAVQPLLDLGKSGRASHVARRDRFHAEDGYTDFLDALFSNSRRAVSGFGMRAIDDCVVHHFYHGGSEALTALVETETGLLIRKFALGDAAPKLRTQADWLRRHASDHLPLAQVIDDHRSSGAFQYDMPLVPGAVGFSDAIHADPAPVNRARLTHVLDRIDALHGNSALGDAPQALVDRYIDEKVVANASAIVDFARRQIGGSDFAINGVTFDLDEWQRLADRDWLSTQMRRRHAATIHGDLTIENIIVAPEHAHGLYIIDPNPENLFDSPLIDWAKMMQSLHLGYEGLNLTAACAVDTGALRLPLARTEAYAQLHTTLEDEIEARFDADAVREVYFHEIVNYLRLTPYKIRQSVERGLAFFACSSLLLRRYEERFA
jgi:hypothetical protein